MTKNVQSYFSDIGFLVRIIKKSSHETDLLLSKKFNVFDYIHIDENRLSDIISDLINPHGNHGQGEIFLNELLKIIHRSHLINRPLPKVKREVGTTMISRTQRRMDILIEWFDNGIMIENKPWAEDQPEQILDYKSYLERRFNKNYTIVYLSKKHQMPSEDSISTIELNKLIEQNLFIPFSFEVDLKNWVKNCKNECKSEKIKYFLADLYKYLDNNF